MKTPKLGQHFLTDPDVVKKIVEASEISDKDTVLEIGPGKGMLTKALVETGAQIFAIEKDGELHHYLKKKFKDTANLVLVHGDVRDFHFSKLPDNFKVAANIPYYLTGQLIQKLLSADSRPSLMVLMLQKEVAERLIAPKGDTNLLHLTTKVFADTSIITIVPRENFDPPPKVDSAVVKFKVRSKPLLPKQEQIIFFRLLKFAFAGKRKKITNTLSAALRIQKEDLSKILSSLGFDDNTRPQELDLSEWLDLYRKIAAFLAK